MKRETVADYMLGLSVLGIIMSLGWYIYIPISKLIEAGKFISFSHLVPSNKTLLFPFLWFAICGGAICLSRSLRQEKSWAAETYEKLGGGSLILILVSAFFTLQVLFSLWAAALGL